VYLLAVATQEFVTWRGAYPETDSAGRPTGAVVDRFGNEWDPDDPTADLHALYRVS
jgi:hypothetical protein